SDPDGGGDEGGGGGRAALLSRRAHGQAPLCRSVEPARGADLMRGAAAAALALVALSACHPKPANVPKEARAISAEPVTLTAADGVKVAGVYTGVEKPKALILLFHQAESGRDEYATIAPRLATWGYASLRI